MRQVTDSVSRHSDIALGAGAWRPELPRTEPVLSFERKQQSQVGEIRNPGRACPLRP
jgi:hypothetical protein